MINELRENTNDGYAIGDDRFGTDIAIALERPVERGKPGRPVTIDADKTWTAPCFFKGEEDL